MKDQIHTCMHASHALCTGHALAMPFLSIHGITLGTIMSCKHMPVLCKHRAKDEPKDERNSHMPDLGAHQT